MKNFIYVLAIVFCFSCGRRTVYDPFNISPKQEDSTDVKGYTKAFEVDYKLTESNVKKIHIKLNDAVSYDAIFDTGCSGMSMSLLELKNLVKDRKISENDIVGSDYYTIADGSIVENAVIRLREVSIVDKQGQIHTVSDIDVSVNENEGAAILVGNTVIDQLAKHRYTIDLDKKVIRFE